MMQLSGEITLLFRSCQELLLFTNKFLCDMWSTFLFNVYKKTQKSKYYVNSK